MDFFCSLTWCCWCAAWFGSLLNIENCCVYTKHGHLTPVNALADTAWINVLFSVVSMCVCVCIQQLDGLFRFQYAVVLDVVHANDTGDISRVTTSFSFLFFIAFQWILQRYAFEFQLNLEQEKKNRFHHRRVWLHLFIRFHSKWFGRSVNWDSLFAKLRRKKKKKKWTRNYMLLWLLGIQWQERISNKNSFCNALQNIKLLSDFVSSSLCTSKLSNFSIKVII